MSVEQKGDTMTEGRGLLTEREREAIEGESSDSYRYKTRTYVRKRLDKLKADAELLAEHEPDLYDRLLDAVDARAVDAPDAEPVDGPDGGPADEPTAAVDVEHEPARDDYGGSVRYDSDAIDELLDGWEPETEVDAQVARAQTRRAVAWLRQHGGRRIRSDFVDALADDSTLSDKGWWERAVQPGLRRFRDADLVEYRAGYHDYRWIGDDDTDV